jgi:succinate-semialdehyde dehydrogenase/glutarate-semialdehyde dehydrogenase
VFRSLTERADEVASVIAAETGKPHGDARSEVEYGGEFLRWFGEEAVRVQGRYGTTPEGTGRMAVSRHPVGPCLLVTPWNFPLAMVTRKIAPALAAGCTVVIKPAEQTPLTALLLAGLLDDAGVPAGVVNVLTTAAPAAVCEPILRDRRLSKLSFTGSTATGRRLLAQAAEGVLRTSMELGGNAPFLVFDDADLDHAVEGAIRAKFRNAGQACTAANRFLVHRGVADEFTRRVVERVRALAPGTDPGLRTVIGPLIDDRAVAKTALLVDDAVSRGARVLVGGRPVDGPGTFFEPTVLADVQPGSMVLTQEIFGPVLPIVVFDDEDEAIEQANDTESGLAAYAFTTHLDRGQRLMDRLNVGMLGLNTGVVSNAAAPFGGWKGSGLGREGGIEGIHEYLETKYTFIPAPAG